LKLYNSNGIIFRTIKYSETSIICDIYTKEKGLRSFIVSGVRSSKSKNKANVYQHLNLVDIIAYEQDQDKLSRIKEIRPYHHFEHLNFQVVKSSVALFILEVCRNVIKEKEANEELYHFLEEWILYIDQCAKLNPLLHLKFMAELTSFAGFEPMMNGSVDNKQFDLQNGVFCPSSEVNKYAMNMETSYHFHQLMACKREDLHNLSLDKIQRNQLLEDIMMYYKLHVSGFRDLLSLEVLRNIF